MSVAMNRPDHAREVRYALTNPLEVCERLGLLAGRGTFVRQAGGVIIRCPVHEDRTPSCSVRRGPDGTIAWRCHACDASGDVLTLVAVVHRLSTQRDFRQVLRLGAELGGLWGVVHEIDGGPPAVERPKVVVPPPEPERAYPPTDEVAELWARADHADADEEARTWLAGRGLDAELVASGDLARVISKMVHAPRWASYQRVPWTETGHRLIVPMRDAQGAIRSVRAVRIVDGDSPKRLPPGGHRATDLVMTCEIGAAMLAGTMSPTEIVVVEGEPDFLTWATRRTSRPTARIGIVNGSWSFAMAERFPPFAQVWIRTDHDAAGDRYADKLQRTLRWRGCFVRRGGQTNG